MLFTSLGLSSAAMQAVEAMGYKEPTPVQSQTIPLILAGHDVIASAQTGTGKTAAYSLPLVSKLESHKPYTRILILVPTRELAAQVEKAFQDFSRFSDLQIAVIFGGVGYGNQMMALKKGADVVVATPGRLLDHLGRGTCKLDRVEHVVLDEADRMLDMGFLPDVRRILQQCPTKRQTLFFSATIPPEIQSLIKWATRDPKIIEIGIQSSPAETVKHVIYPVAEDQKTSLLVALLEQVHYESVIVFCRTRNRADRIGILLKRNGHSVAVLHSDRSQREREQALRGFRSGKFEVLVATDIVGRGIDVADISHVINYDVPHHPEDYVHRIGRTGRAQAVGDAFTLMVAEDASHVSAIERFIKQRIPRVRLENFTYQYTALFEEDKPGAPPAPVRKFKGVRVTGGYYFGMSKRRRR